MNSAHTRPKFLRVNGRRFFSDVEASAVPGIQCCMPTEICEPKPCTTRSECPGSLQPAAASPLTDRGSSLTGNVFVDYRRYSARRLLDLKELQRCREVSATPFVVECRFTQPPTDTEESFTRPGKSTAPGGSLSTFHVGAHLRLGVQASALQSLAPACLRSLLSCHSASVTRLSLDHTGRYLLSSSRDCSIALYDLDADIAWNLNGGFGPTPKVPPIGFVQRRPDRPPRRILHPVRFQVAASRPVSRGSGLRKNAAHLCTAEGSSRSIASEGPQRGHWHSVTSVEFMPGDSGLFVSAGLDKIFKVWDTRVWEPVLDIGVHSPILCCAFNRTTCHQAEQSPSARGNPLGLPTCQPAQLLVAGGSQDGTIRIFDLRCGVAQQTLAAHKGAVLAATWSSWSPYQFFSGSSDKSIKGWDLRRIDSCFASFDKNKPDPSFIGERCSQSAAFRQLVRSKTFMGRGHYYRSPLPDISAAAACAAFKGEPCPARFYSVTPTSCRASLDEPSSGGDALHSHGDQTTPCTPISAVGIAANSKQTQSGTLGVQLDSLATIKTSQAQRFATEVKRGIEAHFSSTKARAGANDEQRQIDSRLHDDPAGARPRVDISKSSSKGADQETGGRTACKRQLTSTISGSQGKRSQTVVRGRHMEETILSPPVRVSMGLPGNNRTDELLMQYGRLLREHQAMARQKIEPTRALGVSEITGQSNASSQHRTQPCLERVQNLDSNKASDQRMKRGIPILEACGEALSGPVHKQIHVETQAGLRSERLGEESLMRKGISWSASEEGLPSGWSAQPDTSSGEVAHDGPVTCLMQSPDGRFLISSGGDGRIRLWNASNGCHCFIHMNLNMTSCHYSQARVTQRARSRNSSPAAASGEVTEAAKPNKIEGKALWGKQAALSSSGDYLVHGRGRVLCTYDIFTGTELQVVAPGHSQDVICVTWNGRKGELYSGASDGTLLVCDTTCYSASEDDDEQSDDEDLQVVNVVTREYM